MPSEHFIPNPRIPYSEIIQRLQHVRWGKLRRLGFVSNYPLFAWCYSPPRPLGKIVLSAGIHGDEPSGVECFLILLETCPPWLKIFDLTLFPCLNPWGYERNVRTNEQGQDLNRLWKNTRSKEISHVRRILGHQCFDLTICLHEDYDAVGFYIYELTRHQTPCAPIVVKAVSRILSIDPREWIEKRRAHHGVIIRFMKSVPRRKYWPEAFCHFKYYTNHTLTSETPTHSPIEKRVRAHMETIRVALRWLWSNHGKIHSYPIGRGK